MITVSDGFAVFCTSPVKDALQIFARQRKRVFLRLEHRPYFGYYITV